MKIFTNSRCLASVSNTGEGWLSIVAILAILATVCLRRIDVSFRLAWARMNYGLA